MDTKWKKCKVIISFTAFVAGLSLLLVSLGVLLPTGTVSQNLDYQNTVSFRGYISSSLDVLLSAGKQETTLGGHWSAYEFVNGQLDVVYYTDEWEDLARAFGSATESEPAASVPLTEQTDMASSTPTASAADPARFWAQYTAQQMTPDKNLLFAVVRGGELLYTNIDALAGKAWSGNAFGAVDTDIYNFFLSFNQHGDGRVEIIKDSFEVDVYGDGWYTADSDWCLPGYNNFTVEAGDVEIYLAAAEVPQLYLTTDEDGNSQYAGYELYDIYQSFQVRVQRYRAAWIALIVSIPLLLLALIMHKSKRRGDRFILRQLARLWFLPKLFVLIALPLLMLWLAGPSSAALLLLCFWLLYLGIIDLIGNRKKQRIFLREYLREKDLQRPVQQKLVRRNRLTAVMGLAAACIALGCGAVMIFALWESELLMAFLFGLCACAAAVCAWLIFRQMRKNRRLAEDIGALIDQIEAVKGGDLTNRLTLPEDTDLRQAVQDINDIQQGLESALQEQIKSERMKVELITNVSHDIKTPLTSIISYVELLRQEELSQTAREFVEILGEKSQRLKLIVQDVFEISKAAAGQLPLNIEKLDLAKLLRQTLADMSMAIEQSGLAMRLSIPDTPVMVRSDGQRLYRVFQNLLQNALQYSLPGSRVFLSLTVAGGIAAVQVKNTSAMALDSTVDFTERFVRGDASRTDGGSGLGLSIAKSFAEACGGSLRITIDADLFTATVELPTEDNK